MLQAQPFRTRQREIRLYYFGNPRMSLQTEMHVLHDAALTDPRSLITTGGDVVEASLPPRTGQVLPQSERWG